MPMKPKTKVMAASTMLGLTLGLGALFFYIEEKKYEALYYQAELAKLQQQGGFEHLLRQIATQNNHTAINTLHSSKQVQGLSEQQASQLINAIKTGKEPDRKLSDSDINAINSLMSQ